MANTNMIKRLASLRELQIPDFDYIMKQINQIAAHAGLQQYTTYSRLWEYPWTWLQLQPLKQRGIKILDVGSEKSPLPWFIATQGFNVIVSDLKADYWRLWRKASEQLGVTVRKLILDTQNLDLPTASVDIYLSVSVIEHVPEKARVIAEAARVLRPGGLLIMTFDICEPEMGMTFPEWNGRALTMRGVDDLFRNSPWFEPGLSDLPWNIDDIPEYLAWHRTTAPHHNYVTGALAAQRNDRFWVESAWRDGLRVLRGKLRMSFSLIGWYLRCGLKFIRHKVA